MTGKKSPDSIESSIFSRIKRWGRGCVVLPANFLDLGSRQAVGVALHRLEKAKLIRRLARGALALHPDGKRAIHLDEMRTRVVDWKSRFFGSSWARYDLAVPGSFRLVSSDDRVDALRQDYQAMRDMYLAKPLSFDEIINELIILEAEINRGK